MDSFKQHEIGKVIACSDNNCVKYVCAINICRPALFHLMTDGLHLNSHVSPNFIAKIKEKAHETHGETSVLQKLEKNSFLCSEIIEKDWGKSRNSQKRKDSLLFVRCQHSKNKSVGAILINKICKRNRQIRGSHFFTFPVLNWIITTWANVFPLNCSVKIRSRKIAVNIICNASIVREDYGCCEYQLVVVVASSSTKFNMFFFKTFKPKFRYSVIILVKSNSYRF